MRRPPKLPPDPKTQALREAGALHPHPEAVRDDAFVSHPFFDPRDRVQVKYEMVRRHQVDGRPVTEIAARFGVSRQTFYQTAAAFEAHGIPGLVPQRPGPKGAHKCTDAVVDYVERWRAGEDVRPGRAADGGRGAAVRHLDPRPLARPGGGATQKKNRARRRPHDRVKPRRRAGAPAVRGRAAGRRHRCCVLSPGLRGGAADEPRHAGVAEGRRDPLPASGRAATDRKWRPGLGAARPFRDGACVGELGTGPHCGGHFPMSQSTAVTADHLRRLACLYVRQSSLQQVQDHQESTARQYALKRRALALGWAAERIVVIDDDLGLSAASAAERTGFQRIVADVGLGRVGMVMGLEVSRLARNSSDWHRLLEICALSETLILDEDGLYDPAHFNDRLLLGLKGTMSEAELHVLRARLVGGQLNKARRGELWMRAPLGMVFDAGGKLMLDPDEQVQGAVRLVFDTFDRTGSAGAVVRYFQEQQIAWPRRVAKGPRPGALVFGELERDRVLAILHNPRYAGAYVYGRTRQRKLRLAGQVRNRRLPRDEWKVFLPDAHPRLHHLEAIRSESGGVARLRPELRRRPAQRAARGRGPAAGARHLRPVRRPHDGSATSCLAVTRGRSITVSAGR